MLSPDLKANENYRQVLTMDDVFGGLQSIEKQTLCSIDDGCGRPVFGPLDKMANCCFASAVQAKLKDEGYFPTVTLPDESKPITAHVHTWLLQMREQGLPVVSAPIGFRGKGYSKHRRELREGTYVPFWAHTVSSALPWNDAREVIEWMLAHPKDFDAFETWLHVAVSALDRSQVSERERWQRLRLEVGKTSEEFIKG